MLLAGLVYVVIQDGSSENPLLDSRFPDVSGKGRGYQIATFDEGISEWPILRKISVWQTMTSLEQVSSTFDSFAFERHIADLLFRNIEKKSLKMPCLSRMSKVAIKMISLLMAWWMT